MLNFFSTFPGVHLGLTITVIKGIIMDSDMQWYDYVFFFSSHS